MSSSKKLKIDSLTSTGEGIASDNGLKVFIDNVLPGELVEAEITLKKKNYAKAKLLTILEASPDRKKALCPIFGSCGGCQIMNLQYEKQLEFKRQRVIDALERIGHFKVDVAPCVPSPKVLHYRNKIKLPVNARGIGLYKKNSHEIIPIENCLIHSEEEILTLIKPFVNHPSIRHICLRSSVDETLVILVTNGKCSDIKLRAKNIMSLSPKIKGVLENVNLRDDNVIFSENFRLIVGRDHIFETLLGKRFKISAGAFFQVNREQTENLIKASLDLNKEDRVLDAFCGVGTFSLFAAEKGKAVTGIEVIPQAILDAKENAALNGIQNITFLVGKAEELIETLGDFDVALLNPPRKGCEKSFIESLIKKQIKKIIYISCDPATLARDLGSLKNFYKIKTVQPFDMFPQTMHVETFVSLTHY